MKWVESSVWTFGNLKYSSLSVFFMCDRRKNMDGGSVEKQLIKTQLHKSLLCSFQETQVDNQNSPFHCLFCVPLTLCQNLGQVGFFIW